MKYIMLTIFCLALAACNPYNPADRALGGAALGAGVGGLIGGGPGAAIGAGAGALGGVLTTPAPPHYYYHPYGY